LSLGDASGKRCWSGTKFLE